MDKEESNFFIDMVFTNLFYSSEIYIIWGMLVEQEYDRKDKESYLTKRKYKVVSNDWEDSHVILLHEERE